jgi:hypothetical protein
LETLAARIEAHLNSLVGLPLAVARRAGTMRVLHFGEVIEIPRGSAGKFALHIQCAWRIQGPGGIITGRRDLYEPTGPVLDYDSWDYDEGNLQDQRLQELLQGYDERTRSALNATGLLVVKRVVADDCGGFALPLSGGDRLVVFPDGSTGELWRLLQRDRSIPHVVFADGQISEV